GEPLHQQITVRHPETCEAPGEGIVISLKVLAAFDHQPAAERGKSAGHIVEAYRTAAELGSPVGPCEAACGWRWHRVPGARRGRSPLELVVAHVRAAAEEAGDRDCSGIGPVTEDGHGARVQVASRGCRSSGVATNGIR